MKIRSIKLSSSYLATLLLVLFPYFVALGAYSQTNTITLAVYSFIAVLFFLLRPSRVLRFKRGNILLNIWLLFILVSFISTIVFGRFDGIETTIVEVIFTFICYVLCANVNPEKFFNLFRWSMLFFSVLGLLTFLFHIDFFAFKNTLGMVYSSVDSQSGGGISTIFEYRHYYGLFLVAALFIQITYPFKKYSYNIMAIILIGVNIVATYTRSVWIVLCICGLFWFTKQRNEKLTGKTAKRILFTVLVLLVVALLTFVLYSDEIIAMIENIILRMDVFDISDKYFGGVRLYVLREGTSYIFANWKLNLWLGGGSGFAMEWLKVHPFGQWGEWSSSIDVQYVTSFMDSGIIGLGLLLILGKRIIKTFFKSKEKMNILVSFFLIYFIFILFFYDVFGTVTSAFSLWCVFLCMLKKTSQIRNEDN